MNCRMWETPWDPDGELSLENLRRGLSERTARYNQLVDEWSRGTSESEGSDGTDEGTSADEGGSDFWDSSAYEETDESIW